MTRPRNRLGLPALTTAEAFATWLVLTVLLAVVITALGNVLGLSRGAKEWLSSIPIWGALALVMLTPKRVKRNDE